MKNEKESNFEFGKGTFMLMYNEKLSKLTCEYLLGFLYSTSDWDAAIEDGWTVFEGFFKDYEIVDFICFFKNEDRYGKDFSTDFVAEKLNEFVDHLIDQM